MYEYRLDADKIVVMVLVMYQAPPDDPIQWPIGSRPVSAEADEGTFYLSSGFFPHT
jgi:hypothetical protein